MTFLTEIRNEKLKNNFNKENIKDINDNDLMDIFENISKELFLERKKVIDTNDIDKRLTNNNEILPISVNFATKKYDKFDLCDINRKIVYSNTENIKESIHRTNFRLTKYTPIIVDKNYKIIDGQHRRKALSQMDRPVVFTIGYDVNEDDIKEINTHKTLTMNDWLKHNIKLKNYSDLNNFMTYFNILNIGVASKLFLNTTNSNRFKMGEVKIAEDINKRVYRILKIQSLYRHIYLGDDRIDINKYKGLKHSFIKKVYDLFDIQYFNFNRLEHISEKYGIDLKGVTTLNQMQNRLLHIYNSNLPSKQRIKVES